MTIKSEQSKMTRTGTKKCFIVNIREPYYMYGILQGLLFNASFYFLQRHQSLNVMDAISRIHDYWMMSCKRANRYTIDTIAHNTAARLAVVKWTPTIYPIRTKARKAETVQTSIKKLFSVNIQEPYYIYGVLQCLLFNASFQFLHRHQTLTIMNTVFCLKEFYCKPFKSLAAFSGFPHPQNTQPILRAVDTTPIDRRRPKIVPSWIASLQRNVRKYVKPASTPIYPPQPRIYTSPTPSKPHTTVSDDEGFTSDETITVASGITTPTRLTGTLDDVVEGFTSDETITVASGITTPTRSTGTSDDETRPTNTRPTGTSDQTSVTNTVPKVMVSPPPLISKDQTTPKPRPTISKCAISAIQRSLLKQIIIPPSQRVSSSDKKPVEKTNPRVSVKSTMNVTTSKGETIKVTMNRVTPHTSIVGTQSHVDQHAQSSPKTSPPQPLNNALPKGTMLTIWTRIWEEGTHGQEDDGSCS
ncbi:hypothetical protein BC829DRAFT_202349 [Chytridium lagenaria]|nr:hypothetical protein BC829DRAFT_202349 [Chytridium lagenaria]